MFPGWDEKCCECVVRKESKGDANAAVKRHDGKVEVGLWQINSDQWDEWYAQEERRGGGREGGRIGEERRGEETNKRMTVQEEQHHVQCRLTWSVPSACGREEEDHSKHGVIHVQIVDAANPPVHFPPPISSHLLFYCFLSLSLVILTHLVAPNAYKAVQPTLKVPATSINIPKQKRMFGMEKDKNITSPYTNCGVSLPLLLPSSLLSFCFFLCSPLFFRVIAQATTAARVPVDLPQAPKISLLRHPSHPSFPFCSYF